MRDEKGYRSYIVDYKTAMEKLGGMRTVHGTVVNKAYELWQFSVKHGEVMQRQAQMHTDARGMQEEGQGVASDGNNDDVQDIN